MIKVQRYGSDRPECVICGSPRGIVLRWEDIETGTRVWSHWTHRRAAYAVLDALVARKKAFLRKWGVTIG